MDAINRPQSRTQRLRWYLSSAVQALMPSMCFAQLAPRVAPRTKRAALATAHSGCGLWLQAVDCSFSRLSSKSSP